MKKFWFFAAAAACVALTCCDKNSGPGPDDGEFDVLSKITDPVFLAYCQKMMAEDDMILVSSFHSGSPGRGIDVPAWDTDGDGKLSLAEAAAVTHIGFNYYRPNIENIRSLSGIEYFTGLTFLYCERLVELTPPDLSKNTALTELHLRRCNLPSLDVSKNTALTALLCERNQLTSLDVSKNPKLIWLLCNENPLTSLDFTNNPKLKYLHCAGNLSVSSLNITNNNELEELYCGGNQLTSLDVTEKTELKLLHCNHNQLTSLDVSKNPKLIALECNNNQLTSLDLSENAMLRLLDCEDNLLTSLDISKNLEIKGSCFFEGNPGDGSIFTFIYSREWRPSWDGSWTYNGATITVDVQHVD